MISEDKESVALALILLRDFRSGDEGATMEMFKLARKLEVQQELENMLSKIPPMRIEPR